LRCQYFHNNINNKINNTNSKNYMSNSDTNSEGVLAVVVKEVFGVSKASCAWASGVSSLKHKNDCVWQEQAAFEGC